MAQARQDTVVVSGQSVSTVALTALTGIGFTLLTGSGWLRVRSWGNISGHAVNAALPQIALSYDGLICPVYNAGWAAGSVIANGYWDFRVESLVRLGAGNHAFGVAGYSAVGVTITITALHLSVEELGF